MYVTREELLGSSARANRACADQEIRLLTQSKFWVSINWKIKDSEYISRNAGLKLTLTSLPYELVQACAGVFVIGTIIRTSTSV